MQNGEIVLLGSGCPCTTTGRHQVEDWCRMCGKKTGLREPTDRIDKLELQNAKLRQTIQRAINWTKAGMNNIADRDATVARRS